MLEDFIASFLINLAEKGKVKDLSISGRILQDIIDSDKNFNVVELLFEDCKWALTLRDFDNAKVYVPLTIHVIDYT